MTSQFGSHYGAKAASQAAAFLTLSEKLREIGAGARAPEDMLDPALAAILEASGVTAGAICLFDPSHELLRLGAEHGLSDEGCRRLRTVRRNDPTSWDMPLQGLLNRRVYLIESASRNRYVPPLVEPATAVRTVACLPIFAGVTRLGSLVMIACAPKAITEADIRGLEKPLRELATMLEAARRRATAAPRSAPAVLPVQAPRAAATARPAAAATAPPPTGDHSAAQVETLVASLAAAEKERARLAAALEAAAAERAAHARAQAEASDGAQRADEVARLQARLGEMETAAARERERVGDWEREHARLAGELDAAAQRERGMREQLEGVLARASGPHDADLQQALERARAAEEALAAAQRDAEAARGALARAEEMARGLEEEKNRAREEVERLLAAVQGMIAERTRLEKGLAEARAREQEARDRVADVEQQVQSLGGDRPADAAAPDAPSSRERDALLQRLAEAEATAAREQERVAGWEREREQLAAELREAAERERQVREDLRVLLERSAETSPNDGLPRALERVRAAEDARTAAAADARAARGALANAEAAVKSLQADKDRAREEIQRLQASADGMIQERERLQHALGETRDREQEARARLVDLEQAVEKLRAERESEAAALTARVEAVAAERDRLNAALAAMQTERGYFAADEIAADAAHARLEEALVRDAAKRTDAATAAPPPPAEPVEVEIRIEAPSGSNGTPAPAARRVVVLDEAGAWAGAARSGEEVVVVSPKDGVTRVAELAPARVLVNLAAPGAFECLCALRAGGAATRFLGCVVAPDGDRALTLGPIEPLPRPLEPDTVLALLHGIATRGTRVLTAGTSAEALISLRQALTREGMSVSMAWDGKQATDLIAMARPEVAVVELGLPPRAGYRVVTQLAACDPVPHAVLIAGEDDAAAGFAAALAHPMNGGGMLPLGRVLARLAGGPDARA